LLNVLEQNPSHDIRNLLKGSSQITEKLIVDFGLNPGLFLKAFFPVRLLKGVRQNATMALRQAAKASCPLRISPSRVVVPGLSSQGQSAVVQ